MASKTKAPTAGDGGALECVEALAAAFDDRGILETPDEIQASFVLKRLRVAPALARVIAEIAFASGVAA